MIRPTIAQAKTICSVVKAKAVIVIALDDDHVVAASYGETKALCKQAGFTLDCIVEGLLEGTIPLWATAESEKKRIGEINARRLREAIEEGTRGVGVCNSPTSDCDCEPELFRTVRE